MQTIIFDTETTDYQNAGMRIIEAAWLELPALPVAVLAADIESLASFRQLYNPLCNISTSSMAIHHIIDDDVKDAPPYTEFALPATTTFIVGHNADFDWEAAGKPEHIKRICTLALARRLWPELSSYKQVALMYQFMPQAVAREKVKTAHTALQDTKLCAFLLQQILTELQTRGHMPTSWEQLWALCEKARIPKVMPFGKHKGEEIKNLPADYTRWLLKQDDLDAYLRVALERNRL